MHLQVLARPHLMIAHFRGVDHLLTRNGHVLPHRLIQAFQHVLRLQGFGLPLIRRRVFSLDLRNFIMPGCKLQRRRLQAAVKRRQGVAEVTNDP